MFILGSHPKIRRNLTKATNEMHFRRQLTAVVPETACVSLNKGKSCFYVQKTHFGAVSSHSRRSSGVFQQVILYRPSGDLCRPMGGFMPSNGGLYALRLALFWRFKSVFAPKHVSFAVLCACKAVLTALPARLRCIVRVV